MEVFPTVDESVRSLIVKDHQFSLNKIVVPLK